jgi:acetate kinase
MNAGDSELKTKSMNAVLAINSGSSSLRFALLNLAESLARVLKGKFDRIGLSEASLSFTDVLANKSDDRRIDAPHHGACVPLLLELLQKHAGVYSVSAIGHRIVHGGPRYRDPVQVDGAVLEELRRINPFAPKHLPSAIALFDRMIHHESRLLGVSEISADMRDLLAQEAADVRAAEAVAIFCYQAKKWIGSFAAALGELDTLVFAGGIGENNPSIRTRICEGLGFLGIELNEARNAENAPAISAPTGRVTVRVMRTDEKLMIARSVCRIVGLDAVKKEIEP